MKSSKRKQKLYNKYLKWRTKKMKQTIKAADILLRQSKRSRKEPITLNYLQGIKAI